MIEIQRIETKDFVTEYFKFGRGDKALVILPGASVKSVMESADLVADAYDSLTDAFTVYVLDIRRDLPTAYSIGELARDAVEVIRAIGLKKVSLFGVSHGGMIAMEIAIKEPELVEKLVLGSTSARVTDEQFKTIERWIEKAREKKAEALLLAFGESIYPDDIFEASREQITELAKTVTEDEMERFITLAETIKGFDVLDELKDIKCPILFIGDTSDCVFGPNVSKKIIEELKDKPGFQSYMYDRYGHSPYDFAPDYKDRLLAFLK